MPGFLIDTNLWIAAAGTNLRTLIRRLPRFGWMPTSRLLRSAGN